MRRTAVIFLALAFATPAAAEEAVATADRAASAPAAIEASPLPDAAPAGADPEAPDARAHPRARSRGCEPPPDRKPHGEVWAGIGTGGYRSVGGVVTQPIGNCGSLTVGVSYERGRYGPRY